MAQYRNDSGHWSQCLSCSYKTSTVAHSFTAKYDANNHWQVCSCGATTNKVAHSMAQYRNDSGHWSQCLSCSYKTSKVAHSLTAKRNDEQHWNECSCGFKSGISSHTLTPTSDANNHWQKCFCGYTTDKVAHSFIKKQDKTGTWNECTECGYKAVSCKHDGNIAYEITSNTQHSLICKKCNYVFETKDHLFEIHVEETKHQKICGHCGYRQEAENHTFTQQFNNKGHWSLCSVCEYNSPVTAHSFKSQSDNNSHWNSCSVCSYNTDKINHKLTYQKDDTSHWLKCTDCDHSTDAAKHTFGEWNIITNPTEESKGEKDRICSECSHKEIAEIPPLNHVHSYVSHATPPSCTSEGFTTHTCTCGDTYIDEKTAMVDHTSDGIWQSDDNSHWNTCSECNQMINISSHEESEWIIDMEADVEVEGKKHTECLICKVILANETIAAITPSERDTEPKETEFPDESEESEKATVPDRTEKPTDSPKNDNDPTIGEYVDYLLESGCSSSILSSGAIVLITVLAAIPMVIRKKHD